MSEIQTNRLLLRHLVEDDASKLFEIMSDTENMRFWLSGPATNISWIYQRILANQDSWKKNGFGGWALWNRETDKFIGFCGLHFVDGMPEVNLGFVLDKLYWGKGYGTEACLASIEFGFGQTVIDIVVSVTDPENVASIKLLEKC